MNRPRLPDWAGVVDYTRRYQTAVPLTQYELPALHREFHPSGPPVEVPPLWHAVVTARITLPVDDPAALRAAAERMETALREIETVYPVGPSGLYLQVAYGLPYFRRYIHPRVLADHMPRSLLPGTEGEWAVIDAIRFPKDAPDLRLEEYDVAIHLKSDYRAHIEDTISALVAPEGGSALNGIPVSETALTDFLEVTTIRRGFAGRNMPRLMGLRHGLPGAESIPPGSMLFMGFTSTGTDSIAQGNTASFETVPGFTNLNAESYFAHGAAMHLSRTAIDVEAWYRLSPEARLKRMFHPRIQGDAEHLTHKSVPLPLPRDRVMSLDPTTFADHLNEYDAEVHRTLGHGMQLHGHDRIFRAVKSAHGEFLPPGAVYFVRQDFNSIEHPFSFASEEPLLPQPEAGLHFIGIGPSSQQYEQMRLRMDSPDLQQYHDLADEDVGISKFLTVTHRQNYLLPPRAHRSLPLAEVQ